MIKNKIRNNRSFIIFVIIILINFIPLPYYVEKDGGLISTKDRINIENSYSSSGNFYMTYVTQLKVNIPVFIYSLFNKNWDLIKKEEIVLENENEDDVYFRSKILLDESQNNAIICAYNEANKNVNILAEEIYVTYIDSIAKTDLKIKDQIVKIENNEIKSKNDIYNILSKYKANDKISIEVINDNKKTIRYAELIEIDNNPLIGIMVNTKKILNPNPRIEIKFEKSESGSSGGLMMALEIYNSLTEEDITRNRKIAGTGTIDEFGNVGQISGVKYKLLGAVNNNVDIFLVPDGDNYNEAINVATENKFDIKIIKVSTLKDAINQLKNEG